jgi:hypothetical protein
VQKTVLTPADCRQRVPALASTSNDQVWVYRYTHPTERWTLSIATHAEPGSRKLSLGGFRIAPEELTREPGFDADAMAIGLAMGMEEKVYWSRLIHVGGPLALRDRGRIVGGKCVVHPTADARVGKPRDFALLDWALECLQDCEESAGIHIVTGQDLGHGTMSDEHTGSLDYMAAHFRGCVDADTSKPTGEGNYYVLKGMLGALGLSLEQATVGLIGVGNIGEHIARRLREHGTRLLALDQSERRRQMVAGEGVELFTPADKARMVATPMDALAVNANKESLDMETIRRIVANDRLQVVCGSENLAMPDPKGAEVLRAGRKLYAPTELGGMMGYLTAVEEYLAHLEGLPFDVTTVFEAARRLETAGREAAALVVERDFALSFEEAVREIYGTVSA